MMDGERDVPEQVRDLLDENARARAELMEAVDALPGARRMEGWYGDGDWSVQDILAHIVGWQAGWANALNDIARGERPQIPGFEGDEDAYNHRSVENRRSQSWEQVMDALRTAREQHEGAIRNLARTAPDRLEPGRTAWRLADAGAHDHEHIPAIREWRRREGI